MDFSFNSTDIVRCFVHSHKVNRCWVISHTFNINVRTHRQGNLKLDENQGRPMQCAPTRALYPVNHVVLLDLNVLYIRRTDARASSNHIWSCCEKKSYLVTVLFNKLQVKRDTHLDLAAFFEIVCKLLVCKSFRLRNVPRMKALVRADVPVPWASASVSTGFEPPGSTPRYPLTDCSTSGSESGSPSNWIEPFVRFICWYNSLCCRIRYSRSDICASSHVHRAAIDERSRAHRQAARFDLF